MRILVFSDTHGGISGAKRTIDSYDKVDAIIHAGDVSRDADMLREAYPDMPLYAVCGNNDFHSNYPVEAKLTLGGKKIFVTHGHKHCVRMGNYVLQDLIVRDKYDLIIYGHTHIPEHDYFAGGEIINPGSAIYTKTYAEIIIENGKINATIKDIK